MYMYVVHSSHLYVLCVRDVLVHILKLLKIYKKEFFLKKFFFVWKNVFFLTLIIVLVSV